MADSNLLMTTYPPGDWREGLPRINSVRRDQHGQMWCVKSIERNGKGEGFVTLRLIRPEDRTVPVAEFEAMADA